MVDYGLAIDVGTSTISLSLFDITNRKRIALSSFQNPQSPYGADVISRLRYELGRSNTEASLTRIVRKGISDHVKSFLNHHRLSKDDISEIVVVGNSPMHHLLFGLPFQSLLEEPYQIESTSAIDIDARDIGLQLDARCYSPPLIRSFIGSDALGVIIGSGMMADLYPSLAMDIGTNSEIIIQYYNKIWVASAASGPAFEGMSLTCGIPAQAGAITRVVIRPSDRKLSFETIDNEPPKGLCGVGAISALGAMRTLGLIDKNGSIIRDTGFDYIMRGGDVYRIQLVDAKQSLGRANIFLDQMDVRMLQQSKASIRATIEVLLRESNCDADEIRSLYLTGAFGTSINVSEAVRIDMFPNFPNLASVHQQLSGALIGAELLLWNKTFRSRIGEVLNSINYVELMDSPLYQEMHAKYLHIP